MKYRGGRIESYLLQIIREEKRSLASKPILSLLSLLSVLYGLLYHLRSSLYRIKLLKSKELLTKVICIGNITTGGTGKTPIVKRLARELKSRGREVVVITSGYASKGRDPMIISHREKSSQAVERAGDESYLLSKELQEIPVIKGKNRYQAGELALKSFSLDIILLDDGFQHWQLKRDLDILIIDALQPFGWDHLLPRGLLREPKRAIERAGAIIISKTQQIPREELLEIEETVREYNKKAPLFRAEDHPAYLRPLLSHQRGELLSPSTIEGERVITFSGIGNPRSFIKTLEDLGAIILESYLFPDHYHYREDQLEELLEEAKRVKARLITTEKDAVKIEESSLLEERGVELLVLGLDLSIEGLTTLLHMMVEEEMTSC